jgi:very-short-patch-repair endonuclease
MDTEKRLIMVRGKDRTADIAAYEQVGSEIRVTYHASPDVTTYSKSQVMILNLQACLEVTKEQVVYSRDHALNNVKTVMDFGPRTRVIFNNGTSRVYENHHIRIVENGVKSYNSKSVLAYWRAISKELKNSAEQPPDMEAFVKREFAKLHFVHPDSVLSHYLNGQPVDLGSESGSTPIFPFDYNLSQRKALDQALRSKISLIEGPPGTGKTQTILNILANVAVMQEKKVAVVSSNNAAVQNVRDKLNEKGYSFLVAALGNNDNKAEFFANLPIGDVSRWHDDQPESDLLVKVQQLDEQIALLMELDIKRARLKQELSAYLLEQKHFEDYYAKQQVSPLGRISLYPETSSRMLEMMKDSHLAVWKGKENGLLYKFKLFFKHGIVQLKHLNNPDVGVLLNVQRRFYQLRVQELSKLIGQVEKKLEAQSYIELIKAHKQTSTQLFRKKLYSKYVNLPKVDCNARDFKLNKNFNTFITYYPIVLSTTHSLRNCVPANFLFDYVIIDESSQVDLVTAALALSCCKRAIIVGDTKQLPQIVDMDMEPIVGSTESVGIHEAYSYFHHNLLSSMLALYGEGIPKVMLKEHYRCHPKIIQFCNQKYYDGDLITFTTEKEGDTPLLIYRTAPGNHMREITHGNKGKYNQRELDVIQGEVLAGLDEVAASHADMGFVTPYRKQVEKAARQLSQEIESDTIHKYQGREKPIMMMSTVLDQSWSGKCGVRFVNDPCKINVAVSRAKDKFILVTDSALFRKYGDEVGDLTRYMEYSTLDDNVVESQIVSIFDLLYKEYSAKLRTFRERAWGIHASKYQSENIMQAFLEDILREPAYKGFTLGNQILLKNLLKNLDELNEREKKYVQDGASVDFVMYYKLDKTPVLTIEVDGVKFHENSPEQLEKDKMKDDILEKRRLRPHRFPTNTVVEEQDIKEKLNKIIEQSR